VSTSPGDTAVTAITDATKPVVVVARTDCLVAIYDIHRFTPVYRRFDLLAQRTRIGRDPDAEVFVDDNSISRVQARIERTAHGCVLIDENSKNGTLVNGQRISAPYVLRSGDSIRIGHTILKFLSGNDVEREHQELIIRLTEIDELTQLATRRIFDDELAREITRTRRYERNLSLLALDVDYFKKVNDTYGHSAGDDALRSVGGCIADRIRKKLDVAARVGGEEIGIVMPETDLTQAATFAESLRVAIEALEIASEQHRFSVTVSIGCAELLRSERRPKELYDRADAKLYEAKHSGRNRVCH